VGDFLNTLYVVKVKCDRWWQWWWRAWWRDVCRM